MVDKKRMAAALVAGTALAVGTAWFFGGFAGGGGETVSEPGLGNVAHRREAPRFALKESGGREHALDELRGNAVIVHFWASWCPPCLEEIPQWLEFARRWTGRPVRFLAVSLDAAWPEALKILPNAKLSPNVISVLDTTGKLPDRFGTYQYPETYLLDRDLRIVSKWIGPQDWSSPEIAAQIEGILSTAGRDAGTLKANGGHP
jgi:thiol-disulfide isomerase/thioredoxin